MTSRSRATRADIIALLQEGHSDKYIGRTLRADPARARQIRAELGLPKTARPVGLTLEQKWATHARPVTGGHMRWTGGIRGCTPNLVHRNRNYSARRIAFELAQGRPPVGRVLPGCGHVWCVAPEHATDASIRRADALFSTIFGAAV